MSLVHAVPSLWNIHSVAGWLASIPLDIDETSNFTTNVMSEACHAVCINPPLQSVTTELLFHTTSNRGVRLDIRGTVLLGWPTQMHSLMSGYYITTHRHEKEEWSSILDTLYNTYLQWTLLPMKGTCEYNNFSYICNVTLPRKAPGICGITGEMLKAGGDVVVQWLHRIFCVAWGSGTVPGNWRKAQIVPVHKKGSRTQCKNYRGISLQVYQGRCTPLC